MVLEGPGAVLMYWVCFRWAWAGSGGLLGHFLGGSRALLGRSWADLGLSLVVLESSWNGSSWSWGSLGNSWADLGAVFDCSAFEECSLQVLRGPYGVNYETC